jgi:hypothetical protein
VNPIEGLNRLFRGGTLELWLEQNGWTYLAFHNRTEYVQGPGPG